MSYTMQTHTKYSKTHSLEDLKYSKTHIKYSKTHSWKKKTFVITFISATYNHF